MSVPHKVCPACGQPAVISMQQCQRCGHVYRTAPAPSPPQPTVYSMPTQTKRRIPWAFAVPPIIILLALILVAFRPDPNPIAGTWVQETTPAFGMPGVREVLNLRANGTYIRTIDRGDSPHDYFESPPHQEYSGKWAITQKAPGVVGTSFEGSMLMSGTDDYIIRSSEFDRIPFAWALSEDRKRLRVVAPGGSHRDYIRR